MKFFGSLKQAFGRESQREGEKDLSGDLRAQLRLLEVPLMMDGAVLVDESEEHPAGAARHSVLTVYRGSEAVDAVAAVFRKEERDLFLAEVVNSQKLQGVPGVAPLMGVSVEPLAVVTGVEGNVPLLEAGAWPDPADGVRALLHLTLTLEAVHARRLAHRDLTPGKVLMGTSNKGVVASLQGLGELVAVGSRPFLGRTPPNTDCRHVAPEVASGGPVSSTSDVYSFGWLLKGVLERVPPSCASGRLGHWMNLCLSPEPSQRPALPLIRAALEEYLETALRPPAHSQPSELPLSLFPLSLAPDPPAPTDCSPPHPPTPPLHLPPTNPPQSHYLPSASVRTHPTSPALPLTGCPQVCSPQPRSSKWGKIWMGSGMDCSWGENGVSPLHPLPRNSPLRSPTRSFPRHPPSLFAPPSRRPHEPSVPQPASPLFPALIPALRPASPRAAPSPKLGLPALFTHSRPCHGLPPAEDANHSRYITPPGPLFPLLLPSAAGAASTDPSRDYAIPCAVHGRHHLPPLSTLPLREVSAVREPSGEGICK